MLDQKLSKSRIDKYHPDVDSSLVLGYRQIVAQSLESDEVMKAPDLATEIVMMQKSLNKPNKGNKQKNDMRKWTNWRLDFVTP
jgi:hypothetical protein